MENDVKRLHPGKLLLDLWKLIKENFLLVIVLFILNSGSLFITVIQILFMIYILLRLIAIFLGWYYYRYQTSDGTIYITEGVFKKSHQTIPMRRIQNVQQRMSVFHKLFHLTSLTLEMGMTDGKNSIELSAISQKEASRLEAEIAVRRDEGEEQETQEDTESIPASPKTVHFIATKKDVFKASFTSFSFLAIIPAIFVIYSNVQGTFTDIDETIQGFSQDLLSSWWIISLAIILFIIVAVGFGVISTFLKYGKYEIASDEEQVFIKRGVLETSTFSIRKDKVQAIEINQSLIKRLLRLAEVKLISAGSIGTEGRQTNSLYPFLPVRRAYSIIKEILPQYMVKSPMYQLPKRAILIRVIRASGFWLIATAVVFAVFDAYWYVILLVLWFLHLMGAFFDYKNSRFLLNEAFIQIQSGALNTSLFVTRRSEVIQIEVSQTLMQKSFGLATIKIVNRSSPVKHTELKDISIDAAKAFYDWYPDRRKDIQLV